jgi:ABC-type branched-subunit amino acid transport system substrate-binding protein
MIAGMAEPTFKGLGITPHVEYYPATASDLSSLGTKVKTLNPDIFSTAGGSMQPFAAVWDAGYRGQLYSGIAATTDSFLAQLTPEEIEGLIGGTTPCEFDPALTQNAQDFKTAWIAKFGKWEGPEISGLASFYCLTAALQKAGSLDTDAVAAVIGNGLQFDTPNGAGKMISRPEFGNNRTTDSIQTLYIKKIIGGKPTLLATIGTDEALGYFRDVFSLTPPPPPPPKP